MPTLRELRENYPKKYQLVLQRIQQAKADPAVLINNFLYTFDPKREPYHLPFKLFEFQKDLVAQVKKAIEEGYDLFIEKCREMGTTYCVLDVLLWFWAYVPGSNFLLGSRKEQYVDNTKGDAGELSNKEESLFGKLEYTINRMYPFLLPKGFNIKDHLTYMSLRNPENGNVITGESSNPNFSRGGRHKAILLDEFSFWNNDRQCWGSTADTTNCRIVITTPGIVPSKAKRLRFGKDNEVIKVITLPYHLDPRKTDEWLKDQRKRRSEEDFAREIMINWETSLAGRVYDEIKYAKFGEYPYQPSWPLYVSWDFGLDGMALQWWQKNPETAKMRLIEAYENSDKPIAFYLPFLGKPIVADYNYTSDDLAVIDKTKEFKSAVHFGDPDVSKRNLVTGTSTRQELESANIYVQTNPEANDFISRREVTKVMLQSRVEVNKTKGTAHWHECMKEARYPQRQETSQVTTPVKLPVHNWTSHHRTSTEFMAVNLSMADESSENEVTQADGHRVIKTSLETNENQIIDLGQVSGMKELF